MVESNDEESRVTLIIAPKSSISTHTLRISVRKLKPNSALYGWQEQIDEYEHLAKAARHNLTMR